MVKNQKKNSAEITIYGTIGSSWWDESISANEFARDLSNLGDDIENISVRINSAGGSVFDGLAIRSLLKNHRAYITVYIDGWAASIASIIAMSGDKIVMMTGSQMMIHNPSGGGWGESKDLREVADILDKIRDSLVDVYAERTGNDREELIDFMEKETWMSATEAVEKGFADETESGKEIEAKMIGAVAMINGIEFDVSRFTNTPKLPKYSNNKIEGEEKVDSVEELKDKYPDIYNEVLKKGIESERSRIKAIEELAINGSEDLIAEAKFKTGITAEQTAVEIIKAQQQKGETMLQNIRNDANELDSVQTSSDTTLNAGESVEEFAKNTLNSLGMHKKEVN